MEIKIDEINGTLTINGNTHEFLIGDDGDVVSEWVNSPNKNEENGKMLVAELLYIANVRQGNKQIERATNIRELAEFIKQNLNPKMMAGGNIKVGDKFKDGETIHIVTKIEDVDYYDPYEKQRIVGKDVEIESYNNGKKGGTSYTSLEDAEQMLSRFEKINEDGGTFMTGGFLTGVAVGVAGKWAYDKYGNKVKSKFEDGGDISGEEFNYEIGGL